MNTEAIAIGIAISVTLFWWLDRSIGAVYPRWSTSVGWRMLRYDLAELRAGWRRQPLDERVGIVVMISAIGLWATAHIVATLT